MFLIFSSNFAGTDIFPGLPLLRYPSSILPFSLPKATFDPRTHPSRSFTHPVLFPRTIPRLLPCTLHRLFLFPRTLPRLLHSLPHIPTNTSSPHICPLPVTTPVTLPTNTLHHPSSRDPSTTPVNSTRHFQKLPIERSFKPPLPSLLFTPIFRPPGNPFPPSKSPSRFSADFLNASGLPERLSCRMSPEGILRLESIEK